MARIYATEDNTGRRILVRITCDYIGCERSVRPTSSKTGWEKHGWDYGPGTDKVETYYCPDHKWFYRSKY